MKNIAVIGAGLSGLMSAYIIKARTNANVTVFEQGLPYADRLSTLNPDIVSGVGGAGTVYGGKFCFPPASSGVWKKTGLKQSDFSDFEELCLKPFLPLDVNFDNSFNHSALCFNSDLVNKKFNSELILKNDMNTFVNNLIMQLLTLGVNIKPSTEIKTITPHKEKYRLTYENSEAKFGDSLFDYVIIATGRFSANVIHRWFNNSKIVTQQSPDLGIRISVPLSQNEHFSEIGKDVKLKAKFGDTSARTFCVCSGGDSTKVKLKDIYYYDGHFGNSIKKLSNFGILARNSKIIGVNDAFAYCKQLSAFINSDMSLKDFMNHYDRLIKSTSKYDAVFEAIVYFVKLLERNGVISSDFNSYPIYLPSIDRLNPFVATNKYFETPMRNVYVIGDAAGISRGFIQSLWSSYFASENILYKIENETILKLVAA
jgi:uncharacterized FAD-dependent dehydrogenase